MEHRPCVRAHAIIRGLVQKVGFRAFSQAHAVRLGLTGWVKNLSDGRVETDVEGTQDLVNEFIRAMKHGPPLAHVQDVQVEWLDPHARGSVFEIIE